MFSYCSDHRNTYDYIYTYFYFSDFVTRPFVMQLMIFSLQIYVRILFLAHVVYYALN